jgi:ribosomal protein S18 acetylase RimI-like enzyme
MQPGGKGAKLMEINLRPARLEDAGALHESCYPEADAEDVCFYLAWSLRQVQRGHMVRLVAEVDGRVVGNAQLTLWGSEGEIGSIVVAESHRRQGLARRLIAALLAEARDRGLAALEIGVRRNQPHLQAFYESLGFRLETKKSGLSPTFFEPIVTLKLPL